MHQEVSVDSVKRRLGRGSAAGVAWSVSRWLRLGGFRMSVKISTECDSEGFSVSRVGYSSNVSVHYCAPNYVMNEAYKAEFERALAYLREKGYPFDSRGWVECDSE